MESKVPVLILIIITIFLDQAVKYYVHANMTVGQSIPIIKDIFHITYVLNPGAAFGILEHKRSFFVIIVFLMLAISYYAYRKINHMDNFLKLGMGLLIGGAIGNLIDRLKTGYVIDFIDFRVWPVFNIADISIVVGVGIIIYFMVFFPEKQIDENKDECNE